MIVIDTSAVIAIAAGEADGETFSRAILRSPDRCMSAGTYLECVMVNEGRNVGSRAGLDEWLLTRLISVVPVDLRQAQLAADAFLRFGKGRHPARLNYGDCFAYALAKSLQAPLLYKGGDFAHTDITSALG